MLVVFSNLVSQVFPTFIQRVYPLQYIETIHHPNQENPQYIVRHERAEENACKNHDDTKENIINKTMEKMMSPRTRSCKSAHHVSTCDFILLLTLRTENSRCL